MKNALKLITAIAVMTAGFAVAAPAANAEDFNFTVVATDYDHDEAQFSIEDEHIIQVNGSDQVSWEVENSTATISPARIKAAPRIHTSCTNANRTTQSQQIWRMTHHATTVVVLPGSCLWNRGKHDNIMMGFKWYPKRPAILVGDSQHRYRHGFSLARSRSEVAPDEKVVGKVTLMGKTWLIVRKCRNFIGGPVDVYVPSAVQLHFAQDIKKHAKAVARTHVDGTVTFNITCPNGANFNTTIHTWADGMASAEIDYTERTRVSVVDAHKASLRIDSAANGEVSATSNAGSSITVSGSCGDNPPPSYSAPSVSANASACVEPGQATGIVTVTATNNNDVAVPATYAFPGKANQTASFSPNQTIAKQFTGVAPGTYTGTVSFGAPVNKTAQYNVTVQECDTPPHANPIAEIFIGEHAVDPQGTMPVFGRVKAFNGATAVLGSPVVTPSNLGGIYNWRTVAMERDGVTPCESGYVCYQGYFRAEAEGNGTLVATATDNMGGSYTTQPIQFKVVFIVHPET